ncbi:hypothetical protein BDV95DRAFT_468859, partial [Massariosphaeria phaeospora]
RSGFFSKALNGRWQEADEMMVKLPDELPSIFTMYLDCVYHNEVPVSNHPDGYREFDLLARIYVLAEKLMDVTAKNLVVNAMIAQGEEYSVPDKNDVCTLYDGTPEASPARKLYVDII